LAVAEKTMPKYLIDVHTAEVCGPAEDKASGASSREKLAKPGRKDRTMYFALGEHDVCYADFPTP